MAKILIINGLTAPHFRFYKRVIRRSSESLRVDYLLKKVYNICFAKCVVVLTRLSATGLHFSIGQQAYCPARRPLLF